MPGCFGDGALTAPMLNGCWVSGGFQGWPASHPAPRLTTMANNPMGRVEKADPVPMAKKILPSGKVHGEFLIEVNQVMESKEKHAEVLSFGAAKDLTD